MTRNNIKNYTLNCDAAGILCHGTMNNCLTLMKLHSHPNGNYQVTGDGRILYFRKNNNSISFTHSEDFYESLQNRLKAATESLP